MPGFNFSPPVLQIPPELLAKIAAAAFRPPPGMGMPGMQVPSMQPVPGFNVADGVASLGKGLGALQGIMGNGTIYNAGPQGSGPGGTYTKADASAMAAGAGLNVNGPIDPDLGAWGAAQNPFGIGASGGSLPFGSASSGGGSFMDFLTGLLSQFGGSGGGTAAGGGLGDLAGGAGAFFP
jgi:hypothetical protein